MSFDPKQIAALEAPLDRKHVATRQQSGRALSYVEGWHAIAEANRIFGFGEWHRETQEMRLVAERERTVGQGTGWGVSYVCRVRLTVLTESGPVIRDGYGAGHGIDRDIGLAHESAAKEAETDAMKRALMTFGNPFGLALYDKSQSQVADEPPPPRIVPAAFLDRWQRMLAQAVTLDALDRLKDETAAERADVKAQDAAVSGQVNAAFKARRAELADATSTTNNHQTPISAG